VSQTFHYCGCHLSLVVIWGILIEWWADILGFGIGSRSEEIVIYSLRFLKNMAVIYIGLDLRGFSRWILLMFLYCTSWLFSRGTGLLYIVVCSPYGRRSGELSYLLTITWAFAGYKIVEVWFGILGGLLVRFGWSVVMGSSDGFPRARGIRKNHCVGGFLWWDTKLLVCMCVESV